MLSLIMCASKVVQGTVIRLLVIKTLWIIYVLPPFKITLYINLNSIFVKEQIEVICEN